MKFKQVIIIALVFLFVGNIQATENNVNAKKPEITGTIIDNSDGKPIEYATIALYNATDKSLITGGISDSEGFFRLKNLTYGKYSITLTFMGYKTKTIPNLTLSAENKQIDLGNIPLHINSKEIESVNVMADQSAVQYKIDKKVVNVAQQLTAKSGTAVDILENVPSVKVDIEGNVSLRGSSEFTVLIDGRPTVLDASDALSQIPAGAIDNIEIITNPSAKYEPDGTAGIINIITKKNKLNGFSGVINGNLGTNVDFNDLTRYGGDATLDWRKNKAHIYFGFDYNQFGMPGDISYDRFTVLNSDSTRYLLSDGAFERYGYRTSMRGGFDYKITDSDEFGIGLRFGKRDRDNDRTLDYSDYINTSIDAFEYQTIQNSSRESEFFEFSLNYKHIFKENKDHFLEFQTQIDGRNGDEESENASNYLNGTIFEGKRTTETGPYQGFRFMVDYAVPLQNTDKIEAGFHLRNTNSTDENEVYDLDTISQEYQFQDEFSNTTLYTRNTYAAYGIYSGMRNNFGFKLGLRSEYTYRLLELKGTDQNTKIDRPDFFPTLHFSYKLPANQEMMVSYTRRIVRPRGYYLEPFYTWMDANNVRKGNPALLPQYVNSFDLGYQKKFKRNFFSVEAYYRITENKIERVMSPFPEDPTVMLHTFENVGTDYAFGTEFMLNYTPIKWYTTNLMVDMFDYRLKGQLYDQTFDQHDFSWNARFNNSFKLSPNTRFQLDFMYRSAQIRAQGSSEGFFSASTALKQDFFKRKLSATLQVRDIFGTWKHDFTSSGANFEQHTVYSPNTPMFSLSLSYKLNNYKVKRSRNGMGEDMGGGEDSF